MQFYVRNNIFRIKPELCKDIFTGQNPLVFLHIMRHLSLFDTQKELHQATSLAEKNKTCRNI